MKRLIFCITLLLSGCASGPTITIPRLPEWKQPEAVKSVFTAQEVYYSARVLVPTATIQLTDSNFTSINHETMLAVLRWTDGFYRATGHSYTPESWDCDKFAKAYSLAVEYCASKAGVKAQPLVARLIVLPAIPFAGVQSTSGSHAIIGVLTDKGYFVVEPQPGAIIGVRVSPLADYKNTILQIRIGG